MWVTQLFPYLRIWVHWLYKDLFTIPCAHFSLDPGEWPTLHEYLNDDLTFHTQPPSSSISPGSKLLAVRHQNVSSKLDLGAVRISTESRLWLRIHHPSSGKRKLPTDSQRILSLYSDWLSNVSLQRPMRRKEYWPGEAAADASASGETTQLGGFITHSNGTTHWFSEVFTFSDFQALRIPVQADLQRCITSMETLAQMAIVLMTSRVFPAHRLPICIRSLSDNTGAENGSNKLCSTAMPQCLFLERLCTLSAMVGMEIDVGHIPGEMNDRADALSRWKADTPIPFDFKLRDRFRFSLRDLWITPHKVTVYPPNTPLLWKIPS